MIHNPDLQNTFIGREKEIEYIIQQIRLGQNLVITGPRRFGKTALMNEIIGRLQKRNFYSSYIDVFPITSINHFASEIVQAVLKNHNLNLEFIKTKNSATLINKHLGLKPIVNDFEFLLRFTEKSIGNYELLGSCLDFIEQFSIRHKKRMICIFDEFGDIKKFNDGKLIKLLKSKLKKHLNTSYLFTGSYSSTMSSMFIGNEAPFYRFARILNLKEIDNSFLKKLYETQFLKNNIPIPEVFINQILEFTNGHPYYSQQALHEIIFHFQIFQKIPTITMLIQKMLHSEKDYLEKAWEEIATSKQNIKTILAITTSNSGVYSSLRNSNVNIYRSLKTLIGVGTLLINSDKTYRLSDPLLNRWININVHKQELKNTMNEL